MFAVVVFLKFLSYHLVPVKKIVPGHHAQEACGIGDRVQLVVEFLKLLVQQIPRLTLRLTARTSSENKKKHRAMASETHTEMLAAKIHFTHRENTQIKNCFSADK